MLFLVSDEDLIDRSAAGDRDAFDGIVRRYERALLRRLVKMTGDREQAEDLCQEAFLRFYNALPRWKRGSRVAPLLFTIATNLWRDHLRAAFTTQSLLEEDDPIASCRVDDEVLERLEHEAILDGISRLRAEYQQVLTLRYYQGLGYREIAELTGIPAGTVATWIHRALDALRVELRGKEPKEAPQ